MPTFTAVDHDPFASPAIASGGAQASFTPVDHDPFAPPTAENSTDILDPASPYYADRNGGIVGQAAEQAYNYVRDTIVNAPSNWPKFKEGVGKLISNPSLITEVGPFRLIPEAGDAAKLPGDVATQKVAALGPDGRPTKEAIDRAGNMAMFVTPGSVAAKARLAPIAAPHASAVAAPVVNPVIEASERLGVDVPRAVATDSMAVQRAASVARNAPLAGDPLVKASERTLKGLGQAADRIAADTGTVGPEAAGRGISEAVGRAASAADADEAAYLASLGQQAREGTAAAPGGALNAGAAVQGDVQSFIDRVVTQERAPAQAVTQSAGELAGGLGPANRNAAGESVTGGIARYANETLPAQQERAYADALHGIPKDARTPLESTRNAMADIVAGRTESQLPDAVGGAVRIVRGAAMSPDGLTVAGIQGLRRAIGEKLKSNSLDTDVARSELERVYGALSDDLGLAVSTHGGPEAATAFEAANALTRQGRSSVRDVDAIAQQSPERAFESVISLASSGRSGDAGRLASIRNMIGPEAFGRIESAAFEKLSTDPRTGSFSPELLARNVRALSPEGRAALFGPRAEQVSGLADQASALQSLPPIAERAVVDRLAPLVGGSAEGVVDRIVGMASSGSKADIARLGELRDAIGPDAWGQASAAAMKRASFDPQTGAFTPDRLAAFSRGLSPEARMILYNEGPARQAMERAMVAAEQPFVAAKVSAKELARGLGQSDEQAFGRVFAMARSGGQADMSQLGRIRSSMTKEEWADVSATAVSKLGRDVTDKFSPDRFISDYAKISDAGKAVLFDPTVRRSLDDIATISGKFKELNKFANPSGTAQVLHGGAILSALWHSFIPTLGAVAAGNLVARILAAPATASSAAKWSRAYERLVATPSAGAMSAFEQASKNLSATAVRQYGSSAEANMPAFIAAVNDNLGLGGLRSSRAAQEDVSNQK